MVSLLDRDTYRVFDGRCATAWGRFSPGRLIESATLERAMRDRRFARIDWMNGCAPEKLLAANGLDRTQHLVACSPGLDVNLGLTGATAVTVDEPSVVSLASGAR